MVAGVEAGATFDAVFELEVDHACFIHRVAIGRADVRGAFVGAATVADGSVDEDVGLGFGAPLVAVGDQTESFGDFHGSRIRKKSGQREREALKPIFMSSHSEE